MTVERLDDAAIQSLLGSYDEAREEEVASLVERRLRRALRQRGIRALLSSRAKHPEDLAQKVWRKRRVPTDVAGCRVLVYRPSDAPAAERAVRETFPLADREDAAERHDKPSGYRATHLLLTLPVDAGPLAGEICEVQIVSLARHAYNELEHEVRYKAAAPPSPEEREALAALEAASRALDDAAERLLAAHERRP